MPFLQIRTNASVERATEVALEASKEVSKLLGKPEDYVMVNILSEQTLVFGGTDDDAAILQLGSLGLPENKTKDFSKALCAFVNKKMGIEQDRIYIQFLSPEYHMWGWNGSTF